MKTIFKLISYSILITAYLVVFLSVSTFLVSQTDWFHDFVKEKITTIANENLNGKLEIDSIGGNFFSRINLENVKLICENDTLVSVKKIELHYMPVFALIKNINIASLDLIDPTIHLQTLKDGSLNFSKLSKPSAEPEKPDTVNSGSGFTPEKITLKSLRIENGNFVFDEEVKSINKDDRIMNFHDLNFADLNLWLSGSYSKKKMIFDLNKFSFKEKKSNYVLKELKFKTQFESNKLLLSDFKLETDSSDIAIDAGIQFMKPLQFDSTFKENLQYARLEAEVNLAPFNFYDLLVFVPQVNMLKNKVSIDVKASGSLDTLLAEKVKIKIGRQTFFNANGKLFHLLDSDRLFMDVGITDGKIAYSDVHQLLPVYAIPSFEHAGVLSLSASYNGRPKKFNGEAEIKSQKDGEIKATAFLDFTNSIPEYRTSVSTHILNLKPFLNNNDAVRSNLNISTEISGKGFKLEEIESSGKISIQSSFYETIPVDQAEIFIDAKNQSVNLKSNINSYFAELDLSGTISKNEHAYLFDILLDGRRLNIENLVPQLSKSKINFTSHTNLELNESVAVDSKINFTQLNIDNGKFSPVEMNLNFEMIPGKKTNLTIGSDWLDAEVKATNDFAYWIKCLNATISNLKIMRSDSVETVVSDFSFLHDTTESIDWKWKIKNIKSLVALIKQPELNVLGSGNGFVSTNGKFLTNKFEVNLDSVAYGNSVEVHQAFLKGDMDSLNIEKLLDYAKGNLKITVGELITGERNWGKLNLESYGLKNRGSYFLDLKDKSNLLSLNSYGFINAYGDSVNLDIDSLSVVSDISNWKLLKPTGISLSRHAFKIDTLLLKSKDQSIFMLGELNEEGSKEAVIEGKNIEISPIVTTFSSGFNFPPNGKFDFKVSAFGYLNDPSVELKLNSTQISIAGNKYGQLEGNVVYDGGYVDAKAYLKNEDQKNVVTLSGLIPLKKSENILDGENTSYHLTVEDFRLELLKGFIPKILDIGGSLSGQIDYEETPLSDYSLGGSVEIKNGNFRLEINNVLYSDISGSATLQNNIVNIKDLEATSPNNGKARMYGSVELEDFIPTKNYNMNLVLTDFLVLNKAQSLENTVYGTVEVQGLLRMRGGFEQSNLTGNLKLKNTDIGIFSGAANDRAFLNEDSFITWVGKNQETEISRSDSEQTQKTNMLFSYKKRDRLFRTGFNAYVQIEPSQNTQFALILNRATGEKLETTVGGNLLFQYQRETPLMTGNLTVISGGYGFYTAKFQVQKDGEIRWSGDIADPELKLTAQTTLIRNREVSASASSTEGDNNSSDSKTQKESNLITIGIEGTASVPKFTYDIVSTLDDGQSKTAASSPLLRDNVTANIISLIVLNQWANDPWATQGQRNFSSVGSSDITNSGYNALFGTLSNHLARYLNSADSKIKFVNFQVQKDNKGLTENVEFSGGYELNESWTFSGGVNYNPNSNNAAATAAANSNPLNFSLRVENKITDNLSWELYREYNPYTFTRVTTDDPVTYGISLFYRKRFYYWNELNPFRKEEKNGETKPAERKSETGASPVPEKSGQ